MIITISKKNIAASMWREIDERGKKRIYKGISYSNNKVDIALTLLSRRGPA